MDCRLFGKRCPSVQVAPRHAADLAKYQYLRNDALEITKLVLEEDR